MTTLRITLARLSLTAVLLLTACAGDETATPTVASTTARPESSATLAIVEPADDAVITGDSVEVVVALDGGTLVDLAETEVRPDEGHLHVTLDGALVSMTGGLRQELEHLTPGLHLLKAEYVAADHAPFEPRVLAAVAFTVEER
jgi:ABC-type Fe3+-hydroxamate transport system substrate-binding protein